MVQSNKTPNISNNNEAAFIAAQQAPNTAVVVEQIGLEEAQTVELMLGAFQLGSQGPLALTQEQPQSEDPAKSNDQN